MLTHTITQLGNGMVSLNIELHSTMAMPVLHAFSAMTDLARSAQVKTKTLTAPDRIAEQRAINQRHYENYKLSVSDKFDEIYLMTKDVNESIKQTNIQLKAAFPNTCYDGVKQILTKLGKLKNKKYNLSKK